jgi:hypothetical protein
MFKVSRSLPSWIQTDRQKSCNRQRTFCSRAPEDQGLPWFLLPHNGCRKVGNYGQPGNMKQMSSNHPRFTLFVISLGLVLWQFILCFFMGFLCTWWMFKDGIVGKRSLRKIFKLSFHGIISTKCRGCVYSINRNTSEEERSTNSLKNVKRYLMWPVWRDRPQVEKDRN